MTSDIISHGKSGAAVPEELGAGRILDGPQIDLDLDRVGEPADPGQPKTRGDGLRRIFGQNSDRRRVVRDGAAAIVGAVAALLAKDRLGDGRSVEDSSVKDMIEFFDRGREHGERSGAEIAYSADACVERWVEALNAGESVRAGLLNGALRFRDHKTGELMELRYPMLVETFRHTSDQDQRASDDHTSDGFLKEGRWLGYQEIDPRTGDLRIKKIPYNSDYMLLTMHDEGDPLIVSNLTIPTKSSGGFALGLAQDAKLNFADPAILVPAPES